ncbi:hypothetical protein LINPERPRIM_LOCUS6517 [Linum perenne]
MRFRYSETLMGAFTLYFMVLSADGGINSNCLLPSTQLHPKGRWA